MKRSSVNVFALTLALVVALGFGSPVRAEIQLTLKDGFIEKYKNRATIEAQCIVDMTKGKANTAAKDGDMHNAVRCPDEVALPLVAEIMNAKDYQEAIDAAIDAESSGKPIRIAGAWRIWNEHGGDARFSQGTPVHKATDTNPDHVFEIHPITDFGGISVLDSFKPIDGFTPKETGRAFPMYDSIRCHITHKNGRTTITSSNVGYNYVEFQMELAERPFKVDDGRLAYAEVRDLDGELWLRKKRMIFVKGTPPEIAVRNAGKGDCFHVLGIPRLDLALVSWRTSEASKGRTEVLDWNLPYEMIVVGIYESECR
jgi:hypothetical protein